MLGEQQVGEQPERLRSIALPAVLLVVEDVADLVAVDAGPGLVELQGADQPAMIGLNRIVRILPDPMVASNEARGPCA